LVGVDQRSVRRMRLLDVELLLKSAPISGCTLHFQASTKESQFSCVHENTYLGGKMDEKSGIMASIAAVLLMS
jgi:hypothetical protein